MLTAVLNNRNMACCIAPLLSPSRSPHLLQTFSDAECSTWLSLFDSCSLPLLPWCQRGFGGNYSSVLGQDAPPVT